MSEAEARSLLSGHDLDVGPLTHSSGFVNEVWLSRDHVIRLSSGRFTGVFGYEFGVLDGLPDLVPHPRAIAHGHRTGTGEYLVIERLPGSSLERVWPELSVSARRGIAAQVADALRSMHALPHQGWMDNPWLTDAYTVGRWSDAYHADPRYLPPMVKAARQVRRDVADLWDRVEAWAQPRVAAFGDEPSCFAHADLRPANVMVDRDTVTGLIDFEGSRWGTAEDELVSYQQGAAENAGPELVDWLRKDYPELFQRPGQPDRLQIRWLLWWLVQVHNFPAGHHQDPVPRILELVRDRH